MTKKSESSTTAAVKSKLPVSEQEYNGGGSGLLRKLEGQDEDEEYVAVERVGCPHCTRMFAPLAAKRHVEICQNNKNKPKPPPQAVSFFLYFHSYSSFIILALYSRSCYKG